MRSANAALDRIHILKVKCQPRALLTKHCLSRLIEERQHQPQDFDNKYVLVRSLLDVLKGLQLPRQYALLGHGTNSGLNPLVQILAGLFLH